MEGRVDFIGENGELSAEEGAVTLAFRNPHPDLAHHPQLPDDTKLWAALQAAGGGTWGGCVYDLNAILAKLGD